MALLIFEPGATEVRCKNIPALTTIPRWNTNIDKVLKVIITPSRCDKENRGLDFIFLIITEDHLKPRKLLCYSIVYCL